jgi:lipopolysaccharide biosynthesis glycosyltransferase
MKIAIPKKIKENINQIKEIYIELSSSKDEHNFHIFKPYKLSTQHVKSLNFIDFPDDRLKNLVILRYKTIYLNGIIDIMDYNDISKINYDGTYNNGATKCMRYNISKIFEDSPKGRFDCLKELDNKIELVHDTLDVPFGNKNLIYYSVYFDKGYTELLNISINSILDNSKKKFDILIITDKDTKKIIEKLSFNKRIKPKYHLTETPLDGVDASKNKTKVFEFKDINNYKNILFLDCDILVTKDINILFSEKLELNNFYSAYNYNLKYLHHNSFYHGFEFLDKAHVDEMKKYNQMPFNAGQFLFRNSNKMQKHFENLNWFMKNWCGEYFFEQAFMCYYFCKSRIVNDLILQKYTNLISVTNDIKTINKPDSFIIHFIAPPLNAEEKIKFILKYKKDNNLENIKKMNFFRKIYNKILNLFK